MLDGVYLQLHLEPDGPLEVSELTAALSAFARQYQAFATTEAADGRPASGRLLVANVAPGSIDINFIPEMLVAVMPLIPQMVDQVGTLAKFANNLKSMIDGFAGKKATSSEVSVRDCDDVINFVKPTAEHGGVQNISVINDSNVYVSLTVNGDLAKRAIEGAARKRAELQFPQAAPRQRVSMIWKRLDRDEAKTTGKRSPDLGLIEEVDPKPHAVMFTDEMSYLKRDMIGDVENPLKKVYYVDVEVSHVGDKVTGYRIIGYHGRDDFESDEPEAA